MIINGYSIMVIDGYIIGGYWCLLMVIILVDIGGYFIGGHWWLFYWWILVAILLVDILLLDNGGY
jgi:hypothetical protein